MKIYNKIEWKKLQNIAENKNNNKKIINTIILATITTLFQFFLFKYIFFYDSNTNNTFLIAVANHNIKSGQITTENDFKFIETNNLNLKEHFISNSEANSYIGKKVILNINKNTPLLKNIFISQFQKKSLPEKIPLGKRLYILTLDTNPLNSMLRVGDKIDLIAYLEIPGFGKATETILNGIQISGIEEHTENKNIATNSNSISFYLYPEEVKIISFMKQYATFSASLRNPNDTSTNSSEAITFNKFIQDTRIQKIIKNDSFLFIHGKKGIK